MDLVHRQHLAAARGGRVPPLLLRAAALLPSERAVHPKGPLGLKSVRQGAAAPSTTTQLPQPVYHNPNYCYLYFQLPWSPPTAPITKPTLNKTLPSPSPTIPDHPLTAPPPPLARSSHAPALDAVKLFTASLAVLFVRNFSAVYNPHWFLVWTITFVSLHVVFGPFVFLATAKMWQPLWQQRRETIEVLRTFDVAQVSRPRLAT